MLSSFGLLAQDATPDSLKIVASINEAFVLRQSHPDSALQITEQTLQLAELSRDTTNLVNLWRIKGLVHYGQHRTEQALNCFQKSYDFAKQIKHRESRLLINLGNVYYQQQAYEIAKEKYQLAIEVSPKEDTLLSIDALNNLGSIHISMGKYEAALTYYQQSLILSDIMMPVMDGFELLERLKDSAEYCHLPVIMLTAKGEPSDKLKALRIGVDDYLIKPFEEEVLLSSIQHFLGNQSNRITEELPATTAKKKAENSITNADLKWLAMVEVILKKELSNSQFTFDQLAKQLFISKSQLQRRLKKITGLTPNKYFREIRLQSARILLESGKVRTIREVAYAVGFDTPK